MKLVRFVGLLWLALVYTAALTAQTLKGTVVDGSGAPVPFATIYIRETTAGIVADDRGEFQTAPAPGLYTFEVSALGYEKRILPVAIPYPEPSLRIVLAEKAYRLNELTVRPGHEDPAYAIMRKVIAHAPYHHHQVRSFRALIYTKGTFKVEKVPALLKWQIKDKHARDMIGKLSVVESQAEVTYRQPDKYSQRIIAATSSMPPEFQFDGDMLSWLPTKSIYHPSTFGGLLSPGSFGVYKFRLDDAYADGNNQVFKIRVTPRRRNGQLAEGWIYITDGTWSVQRAELAMTMMGMNVRFNIASNELRPGVLLPVTCDMAVNMDMMGVKGYGRFYASLRYDALEINRPTLPIQPTPPTTAPTAAPPTTPRRQKQLKKLEELMAKETLTTREAYRMARLMQEAAAPDEVRAQRQSLEVPPPGASVVQTTHDSLSTRRDSAFWQTIRQQPLRPEEQLSYRLRDSINSLAPRIAGDSAATSPRRRPHTLGNWLLGGQLTLSPTATLRHEGLLGSVRQYNFVDGFQLGQSLHFDLQLPKQRSLTIAPMAHWFTARRTVGWELDTRWRYSPRHFAMAGVQLAGTSTDYMGAGNGSGRISNSLAALLFGRGSTRFYQRNHVTLWNRIEVANGLLTLVNIGYETRRPLDNRTTFNLARRQPASNRPTGFDPMPAHAALRAAVQLEYTPRRRYYIEQGVKHYLPAEWPSFVLAYERAMPLQRGDADYHRIALTVRQTVRLNLFNRLIYMAQAGAYPSARTVHLPDRKFFPVSSYFLTTRTLSQRFSLLDGYRYATDRHWLHADVELESDYLLLKNIRFLQPYPISESLHLRTLWVPAGNYTQCGYSIGLSRLMRAGLFAGFANGRYEGFGAVFSLSLSD